MARDKPAYGEVLAFRGFLHAPVNEAGVVCLFGSLASELGFMVERMRTEFPDCEAKRLVDEVRGVWERCLIEFEYRARNFERHGHDPAGADLIVCWHNDWSDAPVDVLELKKVVARLRGVDEAWKVGNAMGIGLVKTSRERAVAAPEGPGERGPAEPRGRLGAGGAVWRHPPLP
jgi:hypothetical protein